MDTTITATDKAILALLKKDDESAMERIFDRYYACLLYTSDAADE